jgi:hypothetical protein
MTENLATEAVDAVETEAKALDAKASADVGKAESDVEHVTVEAHETLKTRLAALEFWVKGLEQRLENAVRKVAKE